MKTVQVGKVAISNSLPLTLIAGPCQVEARDQTLGIAETLAEICDKRGIGFVFKASFDKANRTSLDSPRGPGRAKGLAVLAQIKAQVGCPILTDIHSVDDCAPTAETADILQIPAFLCRQTDLLLAAGRTGKAVNIKKGQFLAPIDMSNVAAKVASTGNENILLTERGTSFGYHTLINDMRALPILKKTGYPVVMDATHSVQQPGGKGHQSGGERHFVSTLARAATSIGVAAVFLETHPTPETALSDGPNMVPLSEMDALLNSLTAFDRLAKSDPIAL